MATETGTHLNLDSSRLLVSSAVGSDFCSLLEQEKIIELDKTRENYIINCLESSSKKKHQEIIVESEKEAAFLLRIYKPEMILGSKKSDTDEIISQIGPQLGLPKDRSSVSAISDRLIGREKVAIVVLNENANLENKFKKLPEKGILITLSKNH